jgi:hypothetical protein
MNSKAVVQMLAAMTQAKNRITIVTITPAIHFNHVVHVFGCSAFQTLHSTLTPTFIIPIFLLVQRCLFFKNSAATFGTLPNFKSNLFCKIQVAFQ